MEKEEKKIDFDSILDMVGSSGKFQKLLLYGFVAPFSILMPICILSNIFILYEPDHWCKVPGQNETDTEEWKRLTLPEELGPDGSLRLSQCNMYSLSNRSEIVGCEFGWEYDTKDYKRTLPSTFDWVCSKSHYVAQAFMAQAFGNGIGAIGFGLISDRFGRKLSFMLTVIINICFRLLGLFTANNYLIFVISQFFFGTCFPSIYVAPFAIIAELCSKEYRSKIYAISWIFFVVGVSVLLLIVYFTGDWFLIGLTSVPVALLISISFSFLPESPRWLLSQSRIREAKKVLVQISKVNGNYKNDFETQISSMLNKIEIEKYSKGQGVDSLFSNKTIGLNTLLVSIVWSMNSIVYYGITLNTTRMAGNQFLNFFLLTLIELPTGFIGGFLLEKTGRRWTQVVFFTLCLIGFTGAIFALSSDMPSLSTLFILISKFSVSVTTLIITLQATEIFPTPLRSTGTGFGSTIGVLAGIAAPFLVYLGKDHHLIPYIGMGIISAVGVISSAFLPETLNQTLPESIDDVKMMKKNAKFWSYLPNDYKNVN